MECIRFHEQGREDGPRVALTNSHGNETSAGKEILPSCDEFSLRGERSPGPAGLPAQERVELSDRAFRATQGGYGVKRYLGGIILSISLVGLSAAVYYVHYLIFHDAHHIFIYLLGDIAFVFIEVLLVSLIIHKLLSLREKRAMLNKLNMVIGAFFNEVGTRLLGLFSRSDPEAGRLGRALLMTGDWTEKDFQAVSTAVSGHRCSVDCRREEVAELRRFLMEKRGFLVRLLENPNLLEHESFTDLLWAVFHLADELSNRTDVESLPDKDIEHLAGDIRRAYSLLVSEWFSYMKHLRDNYPYLFSLAMRTNPFNPEASAVVR